MRKFFAALAAAWLALWSTAAHAGYCGYFQISGVANNLKPTLTSTPGTPNSPANLSFTNPYTPGATSWSFGTTLPPDTSAYVTDICLQDKYVNYFPGAGQSSPTPLGTRSSYLVVPGLWTATSHQSCHFTSPLLVPPGFTFGGLLYNHSPEQQNMIALIIGYVYDSEECRARFRP